MYEVMHQLFKLERHMYRNVFLRISHDTMNMAGSRLHRQTMCQVGKYYHGPTTNYYQVKASALWHMIDGSRGGKKGHIPPPTHQIGYDPIVFMHV